MPSLHRFNVTDDGAGSRLDVFLTPLLKGDIDSRSHVKRLIGHGHVSVNEKTVKPNYITRAGDDINIEIPDDFLKPQYIAPENIPLDIVFEDEYLYIINKPTGMVVHPAAGCYTGTLVNALLYHARQLSDFNTDMRPGIVHRLDADTSGLMVIAKDNITHTKLAKKFKRHEVKKHYIALVEGEVKFDEGKINAPIGRHKTQREKKAVSREEGAREAVTVYKVNKRNNGVTLVDLYPKTGRTHQLRVHLKHIGHPILGDAKYGKKNSFERLALHAFGLGFHHPHSKEFVEFTQDAPAEFYKRVE